VAVRSGRCLLCDAIPIKGARQTDKKNYYNEKYWLHNNKHCEEGANSTGLLSASQMYKMIIRKMKYLSMYRKNFILNGTQPKEDWHAKFYSSGTPNRLLIFFQWL
jgi:hypothetical protein